MTLAFLPLAGKKGVYRFANGLMPTFCSQNCPDRCLAGSIRLYDQRDPHLPLSSDRLHLLLMRERE